MDECFDFIFLPGTKNTVGDLRWLREQKLDQWIGAQYRRGATIIGICGGYQMLGEAITDPYGMESTCLETAGLGFLPVRTMMRREKTTRSREGQHTSEVMRFRPTRSIWARPLCSDAIPAPFAVLEDGTAEGIRRDRVVGTYLHGAFEDPVVLAELGIACRSCDGQPYDRLADWFEQYAEGFEALFL